MTLVADTDRHMVPDAAVGIDTAQTGAGVLALSGDASKLLGAVRVDVALRTTVWRRSDHTRRAIALALTAIVPWLKGIWSTRIGVTRIFFNNRFNC